MATPAQGVALPFALDSNQGSINSLKQHLVIYLQISNLWVLGSCAALSAIPTTNERPEQRQHGKGSVLLRLGGLM